MDIVLSNNGVPIRLTTERWFRIVENHDDVAGYSDDVLEVVENPELIVPGHRGSLVIVRNYGFPKQRFFVDYDHEADVLYIQWITNLSF